MSQYLIGYLGPGGATSNNSYQAHLQPWFCTCWHMLLPSPVQPEFVPALMHTNGYWRLVQPNPPLDLAHTYASGCCHLIRSGPPPSLDFVLTSRSCSFTGKCPQFPSQVPPNPGSCREYCGSVWYDSYPVLAPASGYGCYLSLSFSLWLWLSNKYLNFFKCLCKLLILQECIFKKFNVQVSFIKNTITQVTRNFLSKFPFFFCCLQSLCF